MSGALLNRAESEATQESRKAVIEACKPIIHESGVRIIISPRWPLTDPSPQLDHDFVLNVAKKITDARKQIYDGIGKGMAKLAKTYA